jgi:hypothetical protein
MGDPRSRLTRFQTDILEAFFRREERFFLTGGGALAGYHLGHRETHDLDLFSLSPAMEDGVRSEVRDLVDVRALEGLGLSLSEALAAGQRKDGGLTPAQLAWVVSQITIGEDARLPGGVPPAELRDYLRGLIDRLARLAHP